MGLFGNKVVWHGSNGIRFQDGTSVKIRGGFEHTGRYAGRRGEVIGVTKRSVGVWSGLKYSMQKLFLVDLGGMCIEVPGDDLELVPTNGNPKF